MKSLRVINFLTGASDGFFLPSVVCIISYSFFKNNPAFIIKIGLFTSFFVALVYGLARYFGEKAEIQHHHPEFSTKEVKKEFYLLQNIGIETELNTSMQEKMEEERDLWLEEIVENDLGWEKENQQRAILSGIETGIGFFLSACLMIFYFYIITCLPQISEFAFLSQMLMIFSVPLFLIFLFGFFKAQFIGTSKILGGFKSLLMGCCLFSIAILMYWFLEKLK